MLTVLMLVLARPVVAQSEWPYVVASIKPLHSLALAVAGEHATVRLLIEGENSPHAHALKPSELRALERADVVFWMGPSLETYLAAPLETAPPGKLTVAFLERRELNPLALRPWDIWIPDEQDDRNLTSADAGGLDPHLWLDPARARQIAFLMAETLAATAPAYAVHYRRNADELGRRIDTLDRAIAARLAPVREIPFVVFHDAYQYFERRYGLRALGAVIEPSGLAPGARRLRALETHLREAGARCVFAEPQFSSDLARTLARGAGIGVVTVDPEGAYVTAGREAYFDLMTRIADAFVRCAQGG
jgi:zinc transport system substrate-binding protein